MDPQSTDAAVTAITSDSGDSWDEPLAAVPNAKLRVMCSYGGRILPRPHDRSLCYVGGDTRIVVADRHISIADLTARLSLTLLNGRRNFTLKYQLPSEDLDSLVSVTTDEDLHNMIHEYDRTAASLSRLRLFLFLDKPETAASMGPLLDSQKSDTWFADALNGAGLLPRGLSDSAASSAVDCVLDLDNPNEAKAGQQLNSAVVMENTPSFGTPTSSPTLSSLPAIRVRADDGGVRLQDPALNPGYTNRGLSDDERSDHGTASGFRKPPLPLQSLQRKLNDGVNLPPSPDSKQCGGFNLPSPDSVASDSSITSAASLSKAIFQAQDHGGAPLPPPHPRPHSSPSDPNVIDSGPRFAAQSQILPDSGYVLSHPSPDQYHQHHLLHPSTHFLLPHSTIAAAGPSVQTPSFYPMYAPPPPPPSQRQSTDQQSPFYLVTMPQAPPYTEPTPPYTEPMGHAAVLNQSQLQYVGIPHHMGYASQSINNAAAAAAQASYEYANINPMHGQQQLQQQVYYTQHSAAAPPQYQSMMPSAAAMVSEASMLQPLLPTEKDRQQIGGASQQLQ